MAKDYKKETDWAAGPHNVSTAIFEVDNSQADKHTDLHPYLPSDNGQYKFKSLLYPDGAGGHFIFQVPDDNGPWDKNMGIIMRSLKLKLFDDGKGSPYRLDANVTYDLKGGSIGSDPGWDVTEWRVDVANIGREDEEILDTVTWSKKGVGTIQTLAKWRPYKELA